MFEQYLMEEMEAVLSLVEEIARDNIEMAPRRSLVASGELRDSVRASFDPNTGDIVLEFADHGVIQDEGLNGYAGNSNSRFTGVPEFASGLSDDPFSGIQISNRRWEPSPNQVVVRSRDIANWIRDRGITPSLGQTPESLPFALARGIRKNGFEGRPWINETIFDERIDEALAVAFDRATQRMLDDIEF